MTGRGWLYTALVAIAVGGPYLSSKSKEDGARWWDSMWTDDDYSKAPPLVSIGSHQSTPQVQPPGTGARGIAPPMTTHPPMVNPAVPLARAQQPPLPTLPEALRFDLSPEWVSQRWPQVWRRDEEEDLSSLRVTMVSGTRLTDLAGSLTYSFDKAHQLQRIEFDGTCGDPSELIMMVTQYYGLKPMQVVGGYQFVAHGSRNSIISAMRVETAPVVRHDAPFERYRIALELNHPGGNRPISDRMRAKLGLPVPDASSERTKDNKAGADKKTTGVDSAKEKDPRRPLDALLRNSG